MKEQYTDSGARYGSPEVTKVIQTNHSYKKEIKKYPLDFCYSYFGKLSIQYFSNLAYHSKDLSK